MGKYGWKVVQCVYTTSSFEILFHPGMIGCGRLSVAAAAELSRANVQDTGAAASNAVVALASLGGGGRHLQNQERDLHRWVGGLYQLGLETYEVAMELQVLRPKSSQCLCFDLFYVLGRHDSGRMFSPFGARGPT